MSEFNAASLLDDEQIDNRDTLSLIPMSKSNSIMSINSAATNHRSTYAKDYIEDRYEYIKELEDQGKKYNPLHALRQMTEPFKKDGSVFTGSKIHKLDIRVADMRKFELMEDIKKYSAYSLDTTSDIAKSSRSPSDDVERQESTRHINEFASFESVVNENNLIIYKKCLKKMTFISEDMHLTVEDLESNVEELDAKIHSKIENSRLILESCRRMNEYGSSGSLTTPAQSNNAMDAPVSIDSLQVGRNSKWFANVSEKDFQDVLSLSFPQQLMFWKYQITDIFNESITQGEESKKLIQDVLYYKDIVEDLNIVIYDLYGAMINQLEYLFQYTLNYSSSEPLMDIALSFVEIIIPIIGLFFKFFFYIFSIFRKRIKNS
eukprot:NODE_351_length_8976_cov_1.105666.p3 type:complete len:376 gc:universal NODE_351_length_8976_cov_1.105666:6924-5797(-)